MAGGFSGSANSYNANIGGHFSGGARPQTAEIIKTFGQRCSEITITIKREIADYIIILEHEDGKGIIYRDNKFALFNTDGDSIKSGSTRSLGNSVKDACAAIKEDWVSGKTRNKSADKPQALSDSKGALSSAANQATLQVGSGQTVPLQPVLVTKVDLREASGTASTSAVTFQSNPVGADIEIDGKFAGNTPTMLQLGIGDHKIAIKRSGYTAWERTIGVTAGGNVLVNPSLEKKETISEIPSKPVVIETNSVEKLTEVSTTATTSRLKSPPQPPITIILRAGEVRKNSLGLELVFVPAGEFMMGSSDGEKYEKPSHNVIFANGFWMGTHEVTQEQWFSVMGSNPSHYGKSCGGNCPVENVSWEDAHQFIDKLNAKNDGFVYSLPTEAQWEYAARAGSASVTANDSTAWYDKNSDGKTHPVGEKQPNAFGLYDMLGNVWEWCEDWYGDYTVAAVTDPKGPPGGKYRVLRGGAWKDGGSDIRTNYRAALKPSFKYKDSGFRVVARPR